MWSFAYKKAVRIPTDFRGKRILVRFDGVYSYARVWANGKFVREHEGGFTSWDCDITDYVSPGSRFGSRWASPTAPTIFLMAVLMSITIWAASCGMSTLRALPANYLSRLHTETRS